MVPFLVHSLTHWYGYKGLRKAHVARTGRKFYSTAHEELSPQPNSSWRTESPHSTHTVTIWSFTEVFWDDSSFVIVPESEDSRRGTWFPDPEICEIIVRGWMHIILRQEALSCCYAVTDSSLIHSSYSSWVFLEVSKQQWINTFK